MEPVSIVMPLVVTGVLAFVAFQAWNHPRLRANRLLRSIPAARIAELRPGETVKVTGRVRVRESVRSPFSDLDCAWWCARVEEKSGKHWRARVERWLGRGFFVEDGGDRVWVDPRDQKLLLDETSMGSSGMLNDPSPAELHGLEVLGLEPTGLFGFNRTLRFHESRLDEDELVSVIGEVAIVEVDGEPVLSLVPSREHGLVVSDNRAVHG